MPNKKQKYALVFFVQAKHTKQIQHSTQLTCMTQNLPANFPTKSCELVENLDGQIIRHAGTTGVAQN
jgi:hypothetical protein